LPIAQKNSAHFFCEFARRHGDYAIAGVAAQATVQGDGVADLRLVYFAAGDRLAVAQFNDAGGRLSVWVKSGGDAFSL
jgi:carbon-monoxide dehydrogenase medium subunit